MVQWQLCTLEHLMNSGFGRPSPRHGLQLLFWFAKSCVTCELINLVVIMKLVSDCQPEEGFYGFHRFGNMEELLPVLNRKRKSKRKVVYFEVGNLNTETYPASANLPDYVRGNYGWDGNRGNYNIDRIIISYQVRTRVVEAVYVTEHDGESFGRFSPDRTHEVSFELIQALQSPQLDLTTFLTRTGYYEAVPVFQTNNMDWMQYPEPSAQQLLDMMQAYSGSAAQSDDFQFFSEAFNEPLSVNTEAFSNDQQQYYTVNTTSHYSRLEVNYSDVYHEYWSPKASRRTYWPVGWNQTHEDFDEEGKKRNGGGGISFVKILLGVGALCLAAKCFSWLRSWSKEDLNENVLKMIPRKTPTECIQYADYIRKHTHVMLDYVF